MYVQFLQEKLHNFGKGYDIDMPNSPSCYQKYLMNFKAYVKPAIKITECTSQFTRHFV